MNNKTRTVISLLGSTLLFIVGISRIITETLASMSLFIAYIFVITGFVGAVANSILLRKLQTN
ncbi:hypothetical protein [Evansella clarkii]|uniref:hypothetical protein n=1 Tax=Evansella clarkii TaxID=79879 RepID=UPI000B440E9C|nr:hypothetical protein [Evansella clarkii]